MSSQAILIRNYYYYYYYCYYYMLLTLETFHDSPLWRTQVVLRVNVVLEIL